MQAAHPEIVVIGVVAHEKNPEKMRALVARKGDDIGYRIALQAPSPLPAIGNDPGQMTHDWLEGSYSDGIPQSFLVDGAGRVAWIGPPVLLEEQLTALLAGKLDIDSSARDYRKKAEDSLRKQRYELMRAFDVARQTKNKTDFFRGNYDETIAAHPQIEKFIGPWKLGAIMGDGVSAKEEALAYARAFSDGVAHDDVETLVRIAWTLIEERIDGEARTRSSAIPDYARLGVRNIGARRDDRQIRRAGLRILAQLDAGAGPRLRGTLRRRAATARARTRQCEGRGHVEADDGATGRGRAHVPRAIAATVTRAVIPRRPSP